MRLKGCLSLPSRSIRGISRPFVYSAGIRQGSETGSQQLTLLDQQNLFVLVRWGWVHCCPQVITPIGYWLILPQLYSPVPNSANASPQREQQEAGGSAGINRHVAGDERALQERRKRLHPDPESCRYRREAMPEA